MNSLIILGRQPELGIAELISLYGQTSVKHFGNKYAELTLPAEQITFKRLGGSIKLATILHELPSTDWMTIEKYLLAMVKDHLNYIPKTGKFNFGISAYDLPATVNQLTRTSLSIKKIIKNGGISVRVVPNKAPSLSTAQVLHNHLAGADTGWELVCVRKDKYTLICLTMAEQDINAYTARDQARPKRDAYVGMLPPKLAQIIINLATGPIGEWGLADSIMGGNKSQSTNNQIPNTKYHIPVILDPFCGTGVVLQEALLMGYLAYGTDVSPKMIDYSTANINWLKSKFDGINQSARIELGDATNYKWQKPISFVAAETYLGSPISIMPDRDKLNRLINETNDLHKQALQNIGSQISAGTRLCLAVPTWRTKKGFAHLPILDQIDKLGYNRIDLNNGLAKSLIYAREDQIVGRELVVLVKR